MFYNCRQSQWIQKIRSLQLSGANSYKHIKIHLHNGFLVIFKYVLSLSSCKNVCINFYSNIFTVCYGFMNGLYQSPMFNKPYHPLINHQLLSLYKQRHLIGISSIQIGQWIRKFTNMGHCVKKPQRILNNTFHKTNTNSWK